MFVDMSWYVNATEVNPQLGTSSASLAKLNTGTSGIFLSRNIKLPKKMGHLHDSECCRTLRVEVLQPHSSCHGAEQ